MLNPVRASSAAAIAKWNQSIPKYHRYNGTAVRVRTKVPIRNELVIQLMRSVGIRKIKGRKVGKSSRGHDIGRPRTTSSFVQLWTAPQWAQVNLCRFIFAAGQRFSSIVRPVSVSFEVEGQRTRRLLILRAVFFGRGRSNRNRDGIYI